MISDENKTEIIDQYLEGTLDEELRTEVEKRIQTDSQFRREVALQQKIIYTLQQEHHAQLKRELTELFPEGGFPTPEASEVPLYKRIPWYYAAAIAVLVVAGLWWTNQQSPQETYRGYVALEVEPTRGASAVPDSIPLTIISHPDYNYHYQWGDTLTLYVDWPVEDVSVRYEDETYILQAKGRDYPLLRDDTIHLLQP